MGKYFLGWLLGVPAGLLILIYLFSRISSEAGRAC